MKTEITTEMVEAAVWGGALLGGGGGGSAAWGRVLGVEALRRGRPLMADPDDLPPGSTVVTVSMVGSPASEGAHVAPDHFCRAVKLLTGHAGVDVAAVMTNENGGLATVNGWIQSAVLGVPVLDAPCNGRAHPTALMGSLNLHRVQGYRSWQAACGGGPGPDRYLELIACASLDASSRMTRQAAVQAGGLVAVARNPVAVEYAAANGAPGAIRQAIGLGRAMVAASGCGPAVASAACGYLGGEVLGRGRVREVVLESEGGFDAGHVVIEDSERREYVLTFWNEYLAAETGGKALARFPDLVSTLDAATGFPVATSEVKQGQDVLILAVDRTRLILSPTMSDPELLKPVERAGGRQPGGVTTGASTPGPAGP